MLLIHCESGSYVVAGQLIQTQLGSSNMFPLSQCVAGLGRLALLL